ncbi:MAG TPA: winged helix-turn-helix transcriptional regulator, partial [Flavobacteriales bacterium]|nr:winged helix-turn-helix transcriptional regulator [Flavobacteriales bacterium]
GVVTRQKHPQNRTKVIYRLTEKGIELVPLLVDMIVWSEAWHEADERTAEFARLARADRDGIIGNIVARLRAGLT